MKTPGLWLIGCAALALMLASCESGSDTTNLTEADNGATISISNGNWLEIALWGNPTTGYTWNRVALTTNVLSQQGDNYVPDSDRTGSGGMYYFSYHAEHAGQTLVKLTYNRTFEPGVPPAKTFQVTVVVNP